MTIALILAKHPRTGESNSGDCRSPIIIHDKEWSRRNLKLRTPVTSLVKQTGILRDAA